MDNNQTTDENKGALATATNPEEAKSNFTFNEQTILASLSYLGLLILIPFLVKRDDPFVHFHIKQGIVLLIPELIVYVVGGMFYMLWPVWNILWLVILGFTIVGIVNCLTKKEKALPYIGHYASKINI